MHWLLLGLAITFEVLGTTSLKYSSGFTKLIPSIIVVSCIAISFTLLSFSLKKIPLGTAYAIWSGIGTSAVGVISYFLFNEPFGILKIFAVLLIITGVVILNLTAGA